MNIAERMLEIQKEINELEEQFDELESALIGAEFQYKNDPCATVSWVENGSVLVCFQGEEEDENENVVWEEWITLEELSKFI